MIEKIEQTWADYFKLPVERIRQPGTTLDIRDQGEWQILWHVTNCHTIVQANPQFAAVVQGILDQHPADYRMTQSDFPNQHEGDKFYYMDQATFKPFTAAYPVRKLSTTDQAAFDAFIANCPEDDVDTADVSIEHEAALGAFDGDRIIAVSSSYDWHGFTDLGVLSDPNYRGKGLGKAVVSALAQYCFEHDDRVICYRHDYENLGSQAIARGLNFTFYMTIELVKYP